MSRAQRIRIAGRWTLLAMIAWSADPSLARAFEVCAVVRATAMGEGVVACEGALDCTSSAQCQDGLFPDAACLDLDDENPGITYCQPSCSTVFVCDPENVCPVISGIPGTCNPSRLLGGRSLCWYPPGTRRTYCAVEGEVIEADRFYRCHHVPGTADVASSSYDHGDCDGDGCPNSEDSAPCDALDFPPDCVPPSVPAECLASPDPELDAGVGADGGGSDTGAPMDAAPPVDGGAGPAFGYRGGGGCVCGIADARSTGATPLCLMAFVFLLAARRRTRGWRHPGVFGVRRSP